MPVSDDPLSDRSVRHRTVDGAQLGGEVDAIRWVITDPVSRIRIYRDENML